MICCSDVYYPKCFDSCDPTIGWGLTANASGVHWADYYWLGTTLRVDLGTINAGGNIVLPNYFNEAGVTLVTITGPTGVVTGPNGEECFGIRVQPFAGYYYKSGAFDPVEPQ
jgi:hypothetical protein